MRQDDLLHYLNGADQSVKNFMAFVLEMFSEQIKNSNDPGVTLEYFGAQMEIKLLSFEGVYEAPCKEKEVS